MNITKTGGTGPPTGPPPVQKDTQTTPQLGPEGIAAANRPKTFQQVMRVMNEGRGIAATPPGAAATGPPRSAVAPPVHAPSSPWEKTVAGAFSAEKRVDRLIAAAQNGKTFSASELIGLQMEVFRYSQTVEVVSRTTDKVVGAIKQILGTQV